MFKKISLIICLAGIILLAGCTQVSDVIDEEGKKVGETEAPSGDVECPGGTKLMSEEDEDGRTVWCEDDAGLKQGVQMTYYHSGMKGFATFKDNIPDGPMKVWGKDGNLMSEGSMKAGQEHGTFTEYYPNGQKMSEAGYVLGKLDGPYTLWYEDGQMKVQGSNKDSWPQGQYTYWYANGQTQREGSYDRGNQCGTWTYYNKDGSLDRTDELKACP